MSQLTGARRSPGRPAYNGDQMKRVRVDIKESRWFKSPRTGPHGAGRASNGGSAAGPGEGETGG